MNAGAAVLWTLKVLAPTVIDRWARASVRLLVYVTVVLTAVSTVVPPFAWV